VGTRNISGGVRSALHEHDSKMSDEDGWVQRELRGLLREAPPIQRKNALKKFARLQCKARRESFKAIRESLERFEDDLEEFQASAIDDVDHILKKLVEKCGDAVKKYSCRSWKAEARSMSLEDALSEQIEFEDRKKKATEDALDFERMQREARRKRREKAKKRLQKESIVIKKLENKKIETLARRREEVELKKMGIEEESQREVAEVCRAVQERIQMLEEEEVARFLQNERRAEEKSLFTMRQEEKWLYEFYQEEKEKERFARQQLKFEDDLCRSYPEIWHVLDERDRERKEREDMRVFEVERLDEEAAEKVFRFHKRLRGESQLLGVQCAIRFDSSMKRELWVQTKLLRNYMRTETPSRNLNLSLIVKFGISQFSTPCITADTAQRMGIPDSLTRRLEFMLFEGDSIVARAVYDTNKLNETSRGSKNLNLPLEPVFDSFKAFQLGQTQAMLQEQNFLLNEERSLSLAQHDYYRNLCFKHFPRSRDRFEVIYSIVCSCAFVDVWFNRIQARRQGDRDHRFEGPRFFLATDELLLRCKSSNGAFLFSTFFGSEIFQLLSCSKMEINPNLEISLSCGEETVELEPILQRHNEKIESEVFLRRVLTIQTQFRKYQARKEFLLKDAEAHGIELEGYHILYLDPRSKNAFIVHPEKRGELQWLNKDETKVLGEFLVEIRKGQKDRERERTEKLGNEGLLTSSRIRAGIKLANTDPEKAMYLLKENVDENNLEGLLALAKTHHVIYLRDGIQRRSNLSEACTIVESVLKRRFPWPEWKIDGIQILHDVFIANGEFSKALKSLQSFLDATSDIYADHSRKKEHLLDELAALQMISSGSSSERKQGRKRKQKKMKMKGTDKMKTCKKKHPAHEAILHLIGPISVHGGNEEQKEDKVKNKSRNRVNKERNALLSFMLALAIEQESSDEEAIEDAKQVAVQANCGDYFTSWDDPTFWISMATKFALKRLHLLVLRAYLGAIARGASLSIDNYKELWTASFATSQLEIANEAAQRIVLATRLLPEFKESIQIFWKTSSFVNTKHTCGRLCVAVVCTSSKHNQNTRAAFFRCLKRECEQIRTEKENAAKILQKHCRIFHARMLALKKRRQKQNAQRLRMKIAVRNNILMLKAAFFSWQSGFKIHRHIRRIIDEKLQGKAQLVFNAWRMQTSVAQNLKKMKATDIQRLIRRSLFRMRLARRNAEKRDFEIRILEFRRRCILDNASRKVQRAFRRFHFKKVLFVSPARTVMAFSFGRHWRTKVLQRKHASTVLQSHFRGFMTRRAAKPLLEDHFVDRLADFMLGANTSKPKNNKRRIQNHHRLPHLIIGPKK